ncbi:hypothetical protein HAX54_016854 [Datura stramonium]|uniref:PsbP C-terminal domain-containing protein n=1 Tax=Datura stramonium TaxID=4076 RepID=A0ABS8UML9_DATST|nr:hypothetical protein [Datura stramonium]
MEMKERSTEGKNYFTFEYVLTSPNFSRAAFATIAISNGRHYTLIVGANERRWRKFRNKPKWWPTHFRYIHIVFLNLSQLSLAKHADALRERFETNKHVEDVETIDRLVAEMVKLPIISGGILISHCSMGSWWLQV